MLAIFFSTIRMKGSSSSTFMVFWSVTKYGRDVSPVELHSLHDLQLVLQRLSVLHGNHPSLPTFSIALAMSSPMATSPLAEMVPPGRSPPGC
jgi:hypothetical protein